MKPTIIIFSAFYEPFVSGAERFVKEVVERNGSRYHPRTSPASGTVRGSAPARRGLRFVLFTARLSRKLPRREERPWGEIRRLGVGSSADKWLYPILAPLAAIRAHSDTIHAVMESYAGIALWIFGILRPKTKRILTLQSGDLDQKKIPRWLWRRIHQSPTVITAISGYLADRAIRLGAAKDRVRVIPNGVDLSLAESIRNEGLERAPHRIVCVARLSPEKGIDTLIRALPEVRQRFADARLVLVGDGVLRDELQTLTRSIGVADVVEFRGALPNQDALREIAKGEVFVCPSLAEGLGIVFIEAQAVGTPAIGTRVGGIPDVIEDGRIGLLVPPSDPVALATAIVRLFEDKELADRIRSVALGGIKRFDWNLIAVDVAALYEKEGARKIVIATGIYPPEIGGPATYSRTLAAGLVHQGWFVSVVTYGEADVARDVPDGVRLRVVYRAGGAFIRYIRYAMAVFRELRDADLVYLLDPVSSGFPGTLAAMTRRIPTVLKVVGDYAWEQGQATGIVRIMLDEFQRTRVSWKIELLRWMQRFVARRACGIVVPSTYLSGIVRAWGVNEKTISVIPNAVAGSAEILGEKRGMVVISAGRFLPWKGMETLVRCFPEVRKQIPDARLVLVGDGPSRSNIECAIRDVHGESWVELPGRLQQTDLHDRIREASVFALVSGYEGFSHQLIEAMALGTPIVASNAGGNPEIIRDGENGVLVPYNDFTRTGAAIVGLLRDPSRAQTLAAIAKDEVDQYSPERMLTATVSLLRRVAF